MITDYKFGQITVNNKCYTSDLIISQGKIIPNWWRKKGHLLQLDDMDEVIKLNPDLLIVGTGCYGVMKIDNSFKKYCKLNNVNISEFTTGEAVKYYNSLKDKSKTVLAIHLTC